MSETRSTKLPDSSMKKAAITVVLSVLFSLLVAEIAVRLVLPHPSFYVGHDGNVPGLVTQHEIRGHTWTPGFHGQMTTTDFSNRYVISEQGLRDTLIEDSDNFRILAVGDSFTGGEGVEASDTWPKQLQRLLNSKPDAKGDIRAINAGVTGYSVRQMRQMAEELVPVFRPDFVIVGVYPDGVDRIENPFVLFGDHLVRSNEVSRMRPVDGGYIWFYSDFGNKIAASIDIWSQRYFHFGAYLIKLFNRLGESEKEISSNSELRGPSAATRLRPLFGELARLDSFLETQSTKFAVLVISRQAADGTFSERSRLMAEALQEYCKKHGIFVIDPLTALESVAQGKPVLRFKNDAHWTPVAHHAAAVQIDAQLTFTR